MNRTKFVIAFLLGLVIILIFFPSVGVTLRAPVVYAFGETASGIIGGVSGTLAIIGSLAWLIGWASRQVPNFPHHSTPEPATSSDTTSSLTSPSPASSGDENDLKRRLLEDVDTVASWASDLAEGYSRRSPLKVIDKLQLDTADPEYKAMQYRYDAHMDEMEAKYRSEIRADAIKVRGALASFGITDAQFDSLYRQPKTFQGVETVAERSWDMSGRLERSLS